jgi:hypothetical protein
MFNDLATGKVKNMIEIASREGVDKSYVSRSESSVSRP